MATRELAAVTQFVLDGLQAGYKDHNLLDVTVLRGEVTSGVEVTDWYAADALPAEPSEVRPPRVDARARTGRTAGADLPAE